MNLLDIQTISLILTLIGISAGGVWQLSRVEKALRGDIAESRDEVERKQDRHSQEFGETVAAIRQKVADVELYAANNYVRRDGFYKVQEQMTSDIRALGDKIEARFVRLETKLDTKT